MKRIDLFPLIALVVLVGCLLTLAYMIDQIPPQATIEAALK